jgi:patatin-like phospholipase/acyl hydrolase
VDILNFAATQKRREIDHCPRILSLDGGGVRGLSSLLILREIMEEIQRRNGSLDVPLPCEYFDLIGGTSTGGLIAVMLGRLRMV